jgi:very-short-patch-repair endonuclease
MTHRLRLGAPLERRAFTVREARERGFGRGRLRNPELSRPFHGLRSVAGATGSPIGAYAPRLRPNEWFSHESAARLWNVPLPNWERPTDPVHVTIADGGASSRAKGVCGHRSTHPNPPVVLRCGLPCSDAAATWLSLAPHHSMRELVVAGDHFILDPEVLDPLDVRPYATLEQLRERTQSYHGVGKPRASEALGLIRQGAESRPETLLRLLIRDAQLPEPAVNPIIYSAGRRIGRADLVFSEFRVIVEYDGDQHRTDKRQYRKDVRRWQDFMRAGWDVLRFHDDDLSVRPGVTQLEIAEALARGGCLQAVSVAQKLLRAVV